MALLTCSKGAAPSLELPPWGKPKKATAIPAEYLLIHSNFSTDLLGDNESPLTSYASLWPDNGIRSLGPFSIDEKGLSLWPVKEELIVSDYFDLPSDQGGRRSVNKLISADFETTHETDLLDLREDSIILHPDDVKGWEKVEMRWGRRTPSPDPSLSLAGHIAGSRNRFNVLAESNRAAELNNADTSDGYETETCKPAPQKWEKLEFLKDEDPKMQRAIYEGIVNSWKTFKNGETDAGAPSAGPSTSAPNNKRHIQIVAESYGDNDVSEQHSHLQPSPVARSDSPVHKENNEKVYMNIHEAQPIMVEEPSHTRENSNFTPPATSTPTSKPKKKVTIIKDSSSRERLDLTMDASNSEPRSSSLAPVNADSLGGVRRCLPLPGDEPKLPWQWQYQTQRVSVTCKTTGNKGNMQVYTAT
ncbi:hypothetical protein IW261DRAFT_1420852 [Armillaria novae-zelandiae]|uniref:Uncharacterized protein n=1 Tax=Armillaria novae-zelandiae TaxID=153914 RepID=A0AA39P4Q7_9AGAR|nr:hypothetical protein IW261DRAFT_1420852 [Armillaria novae-zelandiae]